MADRIAFLIGNQTFRPDSDLPLLQGPANDIAALGSLLRDSERGNFEVHEFLDQPRQEIMHDIAEALDRSASGDLILIYYSGHGMLDRGGRLCLATADTSRGAALMTASSIPARQLSDLVDASDCDQIVLLLDCCFSGAVKGLRGDVGSALQVVEEAHGFSIITATTSMQATREEAASPGGMVMGKFTAALVKGIESGAADQDRKGKILLSDLRKYLGRAAFGSTPQFFDRRASGDPLISLAPTRTRMRRLPQLPAIVRASLDSLPINPQLTITSISYGEGAQQRTVNLDQLYVLSAETRFVADDGTRVNLVELALSQQGGLDTVSRTKQIFAPALITVNGRKFGEAQNYPTLVYVYTDIPYLGRHPRNQSNHSFQAICHVGMGGIAAFVDNFGDLRPRSEFEIGHDLGCVAVIFAVSYAGRTPAFRSSGILLIRKGIRYPDDIWLSSRTGRPICSATDNISKGRFIFQSRESKGESCDIFVADYNGDNMCNINLHEEFCLGWISR